MRGSLFQNAFQFPGRPPKLNLRHPLCGPGLRLAAVCTGGNQMTDLLTGRSVTNTNVLGVNTVSGPMVVPVTGAVANTASLTFPALIATEAMSSCTLAVLHQPIAFGGGQGLVGIDAATGGPLKIQTAGSPNAIYINAGGTNKTGNTSAVAGHTYLTITSHIQPRTVLQFVGIDLTTGATIQQQNITVSLATTVGATGYYCLTYNVGTAVDAGRLHAAVISAAGLSPQQMFDWALNDPYGLWYAPDARDLLFKSGRKQQGLSVDLAGSLAV